MSLFLRKAFYVAFVPNKLSSNFFIIFFSLLFIACAEKSYSQQFKKIIGPSPAAAAFAKYGDFPVGTYTGVPNIQIPLYTAKSGDLELPITLSYHAGGFRVDEEAGRAGLGWTVNAGGVITRQVNGEDDFLTTRGYVNNTIPEYFNNSVTGALGSGNNLILPLGAFNSWNDLPDYNIVLFNNTVNMTPYLPSIGDPEGTIYDTEPDVFTYNVNGVTGKFTLRKDRTVIKEKQDAVQIKLLDNNGLSWEITNTDGVRYKFEQTEKCRLQGASGSFSEYITSWYMTEMISPKGNNIILNYNNSTSYDIVSYNSINEKYTLEVITLVPGSDYLKPHPGISPASYPPVKSYNPVFLQSMTFPNGSVTFEYQDRVDLIGDKRLSKIKVNNTSNPNSSFFYEFVQDYFTATEALTGIQDPVNNLNPNIFNKRLKLVSLAKKNNAGETEQTHQFTYKETNLPSKKTFARDLWGFYNGAVGNTTLLPNFILQSQKPAGSIEDGAPSISYSNGANRNASATHVSAFILKDITYPTKGKTTFQFESNDFDVANSINSLSYGSPQELVAETKNFMTRRGLDETFTLTVPPLMHGLNVVFNINSQNGQYSEQSNMPDDATFRIYKATDLTTPVVSKLIGYQSLWTNQGNYNFKIDDQFNLSPGDYVVKTHIANNVWFLNYIQFSFNYTFVRDKSLSHDIELGGGVRIAKITNLNPVTSDTQIRNFNYHYNEDLDGNGTAEEHSYGRRLSPLEFTSSERGVICGWVPGGGGNSYFSSSDYYKFNLYSQSNINGDENIVGYDRVISWQGLDRSNGYTESYYHNNTDIASSYTVAYGQFNFRVPGLKNLKDLKNGSLLKQIDYQYLPSSGSFQKNREIINVYELTPVESQLGLKMIVSPAQGCLTIPGHLTIFARYPAIQSTWSRLKSETTNDYINATQFVSTLKEFKYENTPKHFQPITTTTTNSQKKAITQANIFSTDYATGNTAIDNLKAANIIVPIEQVTYEQDTDNETVITGGIISLYKPGGKGLLDKQLIFEANIAVPKDLFKFSNANIGQLHPFGQGNVYQQDGKYKPKLNYNRYDLKGNIVEIKKESGPSIIYLWSYSNQYPIAEILNASYSDVESALGGNAAVEAFSNSANPAMAVINSFLSPLRTAPSLKDAQVTTYTYAPLVGMTSMTDAKGLTTTYEYDAFNRLKNVKDHNGNIIKNYCYNYAGQETGCAIVPQVGNQLQSETFSKVCTSGISSAVTYTVPADTYFAATVPQANALALADIAGNGQNYANANGNCNGKPYVKLFLTNITTSGNNTYYDYSFKVFADSACTQPFTVLANLTVQYWKQTTTITNGTPSIADTYHSITIPAGANTQNFTNVLSSTCATSPGSGNTLLSTDTTNSNTTLTTQQQSSTTGSGATTNGNTPPPGGGGSGNQNCAYSSWIIRTGTGYNIQGNTSGGGPGGGGLID